MVRTRARRLLLISAWITSLSVLLGVIFVLGIADFALRFPSALRLIGLAGVFGVCWWLWRRYLVPAYGFRPPLSAVALKLETSRFGTEIRHLLATGVDLATDASHSDDTLHSGLAHHAKSCADAAARTLAGKVLLNKRPLYQSLAVGFIVSLVAGVPAVLHPDLAKTGIVRTLLPWTSAHWPRRTALVDATDQRVYPIGEALPIRALLTKTNRRPGQTDVAAIYTIAVDGKVIERQRLMLTPQQRRVSLEEIASEKESVRIQGTAAQHQHTASDLTSIQGELYERLVEPVLPDGDEAILVYHLESPDNSTPEQTIALHARPRVDQIQLAVKLPAYVSSHVSAESNALFATGTIAIEPTAQSQASIGPILEGSMLTVTLALNKKAQISAEFHSTDQEGQESSKQVAFVALPGPVNAWQAELLPEQSGSLEVALTAEDGLASADTMVLDVEVVNDSPATATIIQPTFDESVLATAVVPVVAQGRDDLGMQWVGIEEQIAHVRADSPGAPVEAAQAPVMVTKRDAQDTTESLEVDVSVDVSLLGVKPGDEVRLWALARDMAPDNAADVDDGASDRIARSPMRTLRVLDQATFLSQIQGELSGLRRAAIDIDRKQALLLDRAAQSESTITANDNALALQTALTDRLNAQQAIARRVMTRVDRNSLDDETLKGLLDDASDALAAATQASAQAADQLAFLETKTQANNNESDPHNNAENEKQLHADQQQVRQELQALIAMLDEGQDNWVARRTVESLLEEQQALLKETQTLGAKTIGQSLSEMAADDRTALERIADRQQDIARRTQQAIESLTDRADVLNTVDQSKARAMADAALRGREEGVAKAMEQAAKQARANQTQHATEAQQQASDALTSMLEDIDSSEANNDARLTRVLADIVESLDRLIAAQHTQRMRLTPMIDQNERNNQDDAADLTEAMVTLASNTLGLLDDIAAKRELTSVAQLVDQAGTAQGQAIASLREHDFQQAAENEDASARLLEQAREIAQQLKQQAQQRDTARKREALRQAYRQLLETQAVLADESKPWLGKKLDRRSRSRVRALGKRQETITQSLVDIRKQNEALSQTAVFDLAHQQLQDASTRAQRTLLQGKADRQVGNDQAMVIVLLQSMLDAMAQDKKNDPFREQADANNSGGGGSGDQSSPLVPDLAELKLLRAMQAQVMVWSQNLDESAEKPSAQEIEQVATLQRALADRGKILVEKLSQQQPMPMPQRKDGLPGETDQNSEKQP